MTVDAKSDKLFEIIDADAELEQLADGYGFLEGLVWDKSAGQLNFSDITKNQRGRWVAATRTAEIVMAPSNISNGMTFEADGNLLVCEHATSSVVRESADGTRTTIATHYEGKELNSPNDIVVAPDGAIWFTDPPYGRFPGWGVERPQDIDFQGVFRLPPGGDLELVTRDFEGPNGLCFSPDERRLYIVETGRLFADDPVRHIRAFDVDEAGGLRNGRVFHTVTPGNADGIRCDEDGHVWSSAGDGVHCIDPSGALLGKIKVPFPVANLTFGGRCRSRLFICASQTLFAIYTNQRGAQRP